LVLFLGLVWLTGCQQPIPERPKENETFPPAELIASNVKETQVTLSLVLKSIEVNKAPSANDIYGEWKIQATVKQCFVGDFKPGNAFVFYWRFEKGIEAPKAESLQIGSFNRNEKGDYYVPDNGYVFEYSKTLETLFEKATAKN
jgi:uncharacterized protein (DUF2147 family)